MNRGWRLLNKNLLAVHDVDALLHPVEALAREVEYRRTLSGGAVGRVGLDVANAVGVDVRIGSVGEPHLQMAAREDGIGIGGKRLSPYDFAPRLWFDTTKSYFGRHSV